MGTQFPRLGASPRCHWLCLIPQCNTDDPNYMWSCSVVVITRDFDSRWSPAGEFPETQVRTLARPSSGIFFKLLPKLLEAGPSTSYWDIIVRPVQSVAHPTCVVTVLSLAKNRTQLFPARPWRRIEILLYVNPWHVLCVHCPLALPRTGHSSFRHGHDRRSL